MVLAFDAILDFSELPLRLAMRLGLSLSLLSVLCMAVIVVLKMTMDNFQAGWPSVISTLMLGFGLQLFFLGIAALYIGRIYRETKGRPLFSVKHLTNLTPRTASPTRTSEAP
jgi:dolichol-phosphate mannosyltransferase